MAIKYKVVGKKLTIEADLDGKSPSGSGKNIVLASTGGFEEVEGSQPKIKVSLNVISKTSL